MSLDVLAGLRKTVGAKQTLKAMKRDEITKLFIANDSDEQVTTPLEVFASESGIPVDKSYSMADLGVACRIKVKAAAVGLLK
ncbi:MAG: ribosomal L7Ae/L30e/S12e/Gadd45 family protein [Megasphaera sp.]|uniref:ribosomal L7Ae/L30e/S12e/Gadd45 family protein n=1 Tax=Megasphaera sueciensis TaxID=349094 RepID=UPI003D03267C|nr:ribosomal L7Ae/L30e/S12e/Gadd45 family protein [Megasphaera sp.]MCI1822588.1 ribosomal L7Ae/L30e/S12e/Gadd45 family protein [Megasphaera sp.]